ncbi:DUF302 domain-containing protein [Rhodocytophaga aerolata]|uniref:DUF302 domain-containing protein n=1 Tax=Rhodocytophaga aerolata TaxID=455078 RepID=A0ABT8RET4_9BACT|nr:DUF302 domain-containing protein [Rhodocytophaga aerolata]MDO1449260.1 DUF302 domain-containing protein [Rhodocytophaga aerolata]
MSYNFTKKTSLPFEEAIKKITEELKKEGFGIISEIDLKEKFKEKLGVDFRSYKILGACNPKMAYQAIEKESNIGTMLPCNILVQEHKPGEVEISAINPMESMSAVHNKELEAIATQVSNSLQAVINRL